MATDVSILSAAREVAAALEAMRDADQAKLVADRAASLATEKANAAHKRAIDAERRLVELSRQKPAEPAPESPKIEVIQPAASGGYEKVKVTAEQIKDAHSQKKQPRIGAGG